MLDYAFLGVRRTCCGTYKHTAVEGQWDFRRDYGRTAPLSIFDQYDIGLDDGLNDGYLFVSTGLSELVHS